MMRMKAIVVFYLMVLRLALAELKVGFYESSCPNAESIIKGVVEKRFKSDISIPAALLRMHFHDCFSTGSDASILLDSTDGSQSEKEAGPNFTVRGYELIDEAKLALEQVCPSQVSCADIMNLATRDSVALAGGPNYEVPTGRRDGVKSNPDQVLLPGPGVSVQEAFQVFKEKNFTMEDMVALLGAHTIGVVHCDLFSDRLENFQESGQPDPTMDPVLVTKLKKICANESNPTENLDQGTPNIFDNEYFNQIRSKKGVTKIDQNLADDELSKEIVSSFASDAKLFATKFGEAMVKMGNIEVLVGDVGEIRKNCRVVNGKDIQ